MPKKSDIALKASTSTICCHNKWFKKSHDDAHHIEDEETFQTNWPFSEGTLRKEGVNNFLLLHRFSSPDHFSSSQPHLLRLRDDDNKDRRLLSPTPVLVKPLPTKVGSRFFSLLYHNHRPFHNTPINNRPFCSSIFSLIWFFIVLSCCFPPTCLLFALTESNFTATPTLTTSTTNQLNRQKNNDRQKQHQNQGLQQPALITATTFMVSSASLKQYERFKDATCVEYDKESPIEKASTLSAESSQESLISGSRPPSASPHSFSSAAKHKEDNNTFKNPQRQQHQWMLQPNTLYDTVKSAQTLPMAALSQFTGSTRSRGITQLSPQALQTLTYGYFKFESLVFHTALRERLLRSSNNVEGDALLVSDDTIPFSDSDNLWDLGNNSSSLPLGFGQSSSRKFLTLDEQQFVTNDFDNARFQSKLEQHRFQWFINNYHDPRLYAPIPQFCRAKKKILEEEEIRRSRVTHRERQKSELQVFEDFIINKIIGSVKIGGGGIGIAGISG